MTSCIVIISICGILYLLCRVALEAPSAGSLAAWCNAMLGTFMKKGEFVTMKKAMICCLVAVVVLTTCAFAEEGDYDVLDPEETVESVLLDEEDDSSDDEESGDDDASGSDSGDSDSSGEDVEATEAPSPTWPADIQSSFDDGETGNDPVETTTAVSTPTPTPMEFIIADIEATESPEPSESPDPEVMTFEEETLTTLGSIEGILIFFAVVLLCWLVYKFFRIFF